MLEEDTNAHAPQYYSATYIVTWMHAVHTINYNVLYPLPYTMIASCLQGLPFHSPAHGTQIQHHAHRYVCSGREPNWMQIPINALSNGLHIQQLYKVARNAFVTHD